MKNKIIMSVCFVLAGLFSTQLMYAQDNTCIDSHKDQVCSGGELYTNGTPYPNGVPYTATDYQKEIKSRFCDDDWLLWTGDACSSVENEGTGTLNYEFLLEGIWNEDTPTGISNTANGGAPNYVILSDKDCRITATGDCKWPLAVSNAGIKYILLTPGDYRDFGVFEPRRAGSEGEKRYLLYYRGMVGDDVIDIKNYYNTYFTTTPIESAELYKVQDREAIIENFKFTVNASYNDSDWVLIGISIRGNHSWRQDDENDKWGSGSSTSIIHTDRNIIESCLFENQVVGNYLKITNGDNNIIHNCVIRNQQECMITYLAGNDIIGITIQATCIGGTAFDNKVINNKIYNVTDAIQTVYGPDGNALPPDGDGTSDDDIVGEVPGTFIYGNELYNERMYVDDCGEERMNGEGAIDIKQGVGGYGEGCYVDITKKLIIANNHIYGWRRAGTDGLGRVVEDRELHGIPLKTHPYKGDCEHDANGRGGGGGDAVTCHINAKNVVIYKNTVSDCSNGFLIGGGSGEDYYHNNLGVRHIEVFENTICNLYPPAELYSDMSSYWQTPNSYTINMHNIPNTVQPFSYTQGHQIGVAIKAIPVSTRVIGNKVMNTIHGVSVNNALSGTDNPIEVSDNYFENVLEQEFNKCQTYSQFINNAFANSGYALSCSGTDCEILRSGLNGDSGLIGNNNCFFSTDTDPNPNVDTSDNDTLCD